MSNRGLTQEQLKLLLDYDADTGIFRWRIATGGRKVGDAAGGLSGKGYIAVKIGRLQYKAHRLAWLYTYGQWPNGQVDHKNRNKADNRVDNLKDVTQSENKQNCLMYACNTSGFKGVTYYPRNGKWNAAIKVNGKRKHLGYYEKPEDASHAYQQAVARYHTNAPVQACPTQQ